MHLDIQKIHTGPLTTMVKKLLLMDTTVYLNLSGERLFSNSYIPSKDVGDSSWFVSLAGVYIPHGHGHHCVLSG